ncbi:MAG: rod shape-determining protein RodA [Janthinobacterium lividum]
MISLSPNFFQKLKQINLVIVLVLAIIASIGFVVLYSAAGGDFSPWAGKQIIRFGVGIVILSGVAMIDLKTWMRYSYVLYLLSLLMLVAVEITGRIGMGAQRWIDLYVINIQPSELMKITLLMALARYFHECTLEEIRKLKNLVIPSILILIPALLVLRQPDLGTAMLLILAGSAIFFVAGIRLWKVAVMGGLVLSAIPVFWHFMYDYQKERVLNFLDPERDPLGTSYNILQSIIALGSGGLWGKGFQLGSQSHLKFLPEKQTDFIFATFIEEFGVIGGLTLLLLYLSLIIYGYRMALLSRSAYGRYLGLGLTTLLFLYIFINMGMVMGLVPAVGIPLPLMSYGGTALLTVMLSMGLLMSISIHREDRIGRSGFFI